MSNVTTTPCRILSLCLTTPLITTGHNIIMNPRKPLNPDAPAFYPRGLNPNAQPFVPAAMTRAATTIQATFRGHLGRRRATLVRNLMDDANRRHGNLPIERTIRPNNPPLATINQTLFRRGQAARSFTTYATFDARGGPVRRVDITGAAHGGIPTPHVLDFTPVARVTPTGPLTQYSTPQGNRVRPAHYWEIP